MTDTRAFGTLAQREVEAMTGIELPLAIKIGSAAAGALAKLFSSAKSAVEVTKEIRALKSARKVNKNVERVGLVFRMATERKLEKSIQHFDASRRSIESAYKVLETATPLALAVASSWRRELIFSIPARIVAAVGSVIGLTLVPAMAVVDNLSWTFLALVYGGGGVLLGWIPWKRGIHATMNALQRIATKAEEAESAPGRMKTFMVGPGLVQIGFLKQYVALVRDVREQESAVFGALFRYAGTELKDNRAVELQLIMAILALRSTEQLRAKPAEESDRKLWQENQRKVLQPILEKHGLWEQDVANDLLAEDFVSRREDEILNGWILQGRIRGIAALPSATTIVRPKSPAGA